MRCMCSDKHSVTLTAMKQGASHPTAHGVVPISLKTQQNPLGGDKEVQAAHPTVREYSCNRRNKTRHKTNTHKPPSLCCIACCSAGTCPVALYNLDCCWPCRAGFLAHATTSSSSSSSQPALGCVCLQAFGPYLPAGSPAVDGLDLASLHKASTQP